MATLIPDFKRDAEDASKWVNNTSGTVTNRTGYALTPLPVIDGQAKAQRDSTITAILGYESEVLNTRDNAEQSFQDAIGSLTVTAPFDFVQGGTVTARNQAILYPTDGKQYRWDGALPKDVPADSSPSTTGGIDVGAWVDVGQAAIRADLADGSANIAGQPASEVAKSANPVTRGKSLVPKIFTALTPKKKSALLKLSDTEYRFFMHLGGATWQVMGFRNSGLDAAGNVTPYGWNETFIEDLEEYVAWGDPEATFNGTSSELLSFDPAPYVGYKARQMVSVGGFVEVQFSVTEDGGDVYLVFVGRTNGNIVGVTIDGSTDLVNESQTVDTYTENDLAFRQKVLVASNLPAKNTPYTVRFTLTADKNPASGTGDRFIFNAIQLAAANFGNPWSEKVRPKPWMPNKPYELREEVLGGNGRFFVCSEAGTSGEQIPTHTSGTQTDGTVSWDAIQTSSFIDKSTIAQAQGSQLEYAYQFRPDGVEEYNDVGGNLHGNEYITDISFVIDGFKKSPRQGVYVVGFDINVVQDIYAYYGAIGTETKIADTILTHSMGGGKVVVSHESGFVVSGNFGYNYPAMWPMLFYTNRGFQEVFDEMELTQEGRIAPIDYAGQSNPFVGETTDLQMRAIGQVYRPKGTSDSPSSGAGEYYCVATLNTTDYAVGQYEFGTRLASMAPNLAGRTEASGFSSWPIKMYFTRSNTAKTEQVFAGKKVRADSEYRLSLFRK